MFGSVSCDCCQSSVIQLVNKVSRGLVVWRSGIVVRHINEVTLRRARLGLGWVTIFGPVYHPTRLTQPCILLGSLHRVPTVTGWGKGGHVTSVGWQITLCDPIWHVSFCSKLLQSIHFNLLTHFAVAVYWLRVPISRCHCLPGGAFSKVPRKILGKLLILGATDTQVATSSSGYSATVEHCTNRPVNSVQWSNRK